MTLVASRDLRINTRALLGRVDAGEVFTIALDGRTVAELRPISTGPNWMTRVELRDS